eukprot:TRINITY_DN3976_c1_g1_i1.p1 TRINITY_DN3976_c1_g1~~TRINITY_DN3976_c1_g1_i1.p1  ORF type:complete len:309 (-),score=72.24 TRINITY_DN3976_c1_g1_i1:9-935(-)
MSHQDDVVMEEQVVTQEVLKKLEPVKLTPEEQKELEYNRREANREAARLRRERQDKIAYDNQIKMRLEEARREREEREKREKETLHINKGPEIDMTEIQRQARKRREEQQIINSKRFAPHNEQTTISMPPTSSVASVHPQNPEVHTRTGAMKTIQIRFPSGTTPDVTKTEFSGNEPLREVFHYIASFLSPGVCFKLVQGYPKMEFYRSLLNKTLVELGIPSRVSLSVVVVKGDYVEVKNAVGEEKGLFLKERVFSSKKEKDEEEESCPICQCSYEEGEVLRQLRCTHEFHSKCIAEWLEGGNGCPYCQ